MNLNEIHTITIEKMVYEGKSLGRINNIPVFVEDGCPEDVVKIRITKTNKNYLIGEILEIIKPSKYRVKPFCPMHKICGSCSWQHIQYEEQLRQKKNIVKETIKHITGIDIEPNEIIPSPLLKEYRCKVQYPAAEKKGSGRIISGYYKKNSHDLINIKYCPIQPPIINEINEFIKEKAQNSNISAYSEKFHSGLLKHIIYRISSDLSQILIIFVINSDSTNSKLYELAKELKQKYPQIIGVCENYNTKKTNVILSEETKCLLGNDYYFENLSDIIYKISANSFFQVNPFSAVNIFNKIKELVSENAKDSIILDAYSGVSSIGIWISSVCSKVVCVEEIKSASADAQENIKLNKINNVEIINGDAGKIFEEFIDSGRSFDVSIIDPPRKGASEDSLLYLSKMTTKYIIYVSCNPSTLARDMKILIKNNFIPESLSLVDMFCHTYHIESIVLFKKNIKKED